jgi:transposase InsO family protein
MRSEDVRRGMGVRTAASKYGVIPGTISKWVKKAKKQGYGLIPTLSPRPHSHPHVLSDDVVEKIVDVRLETKRCAEVVHKTLENSGIIVSLSSVKRTLERQYLSKKRSPWKRFHAPIPRPEVEKAGDLVEVDTVHIMPPDGTRIYVFTCLDVFSRWAYARAYEKCNTRTALDFLQRAQGEALFTFLHIQSDHGPEFSTSFTNRSGVEHRHSRVRKPNDNAHLERFNRTIQEECLDRLPREVALINRALPKYLKYYNEKRLHFGLKLQTPISFIHSKVFPRY